ncbi:hypothetical protein V2O64_09040 [Verrucomicrobiaceae bacterium 227]
MTKRKSGLVDFYATKALVGFVCVVLSGYALVGLWLMGDCSKPGSLREEVSMFYSDWGGLVLIFHAVSTLYWVLLKPGSGLGINLILAPVWFPLSELVVMYSVLGHFYL